MKEKINIYDAEGYNELGFNADGIHKVTKTKYDPEGYDQFGYDYHQFDRSGINKKTGRKYNIYGFDKDGINKYTGTKYGDYKCRGRDINGFSEDGIHYCYNKKLKYLNGYDAEGYDIRGFNIIGINKETGTRYNKYGFDVTGEDIDGFIGSIHVITGTKYDEDGYDIKGFNIDGIHKITGTKYNQDGYDIDGYDINGFDIDEIHKITGTKYDPQGFNKWGKDKYFNTKKEVLETSKKFLESKLNITDFCKKEKIKIVDFNHIRESLNNLCPDIAKELEEKIEGMQKQTFVAVTEVTKKILIDIQYGIPIGDNTFRPYQTLDFAMEKISLNTMSEIIKNTNMTVDKSFPKFKSKWNNRNKRRLNIKQILDGFYSIKVDDELIEATLDDKKSAYDFLKNHHIDYEEGFYNQALNRVIKERVKNEQKENPIQKIKIDENK